MGTTKKTDIYEIVKDNLVRRIEEISTGKLAGRWQKPWSLQTLCPINHVSGREYSGVNLWLLNGYGSEFLTWNQIRELQATQKHKNIKLRKGSRSHIVIYFKMVEHKDSNTDEETIIPVLRYYNVFSLDDMEGIELRRKPSTYEHTSTEAEAKLEEALTKYFSREGIAVRTIKSDGCYYSPNQHSISIPEARYFERVDTRLSALSHEAIHSTCRKMGRPINCDKSSFEYCYEELIAEAGAAILLAKFGVSNEYSETNSSVYLHGWMTRIKETPAKKLVSALNAASKAVECILAEETKTDLRADYEG